ncbi:MAG: hypothetical protein AABM29_03305 [Actinomycetota bacterium]
MGGTSEELHDERALVGWAVFPDDGSDVATLMRAADQRLHERKRGLRQIA